MGTTDRGGTLPGGEKGNGERAPRDLAAGPCSKVASPSGPAARTVLPCGRQHRAGPEHGGRQQAPDTA